MSLRTERTETMTADEAKAVIALATRDDGLGVSVQDVAELLHVPAENVAGLLAQVRASTPSGARAMAGAWERGVLRLIGLFGASCLLALLVIVRSVHVFGAELNSHLQGLLVCGIVAIAIAAVGLNGGRRRRPGSVQSKM